MSVYKPLKFRITGVVPMLQHNSQTIDPLNPHSKSIAEISGKRKKTEADHIEIARREFMAGLYIGSDGAPCIPAEMIEATMIRGAMKGKMGAQAKAGLIVEDNSKLIYKGPQTADSLWKDRDKSFEFRIAVRVSTSRVMRTRPIFKEWSADVVVKYQPDLLNESHVRSFIQTAGEQIGIGDWRPRFGRFIVS